MCVRKVAARARTHAAHHCGAQLWSDAFRRVGVSSLGSITSVSSDFWSRFRSNHARTHAGTHAGRHARSDQLLKEAGDEARGDSSR